MTWLISAGEALLPEIGKQAISLGISGLLFVMWWSERHERLKDGSKAREVLGQARQLATLNQQLLDVLRSNTEALVALRGEIRSQRDALREWTERAWRGVVGRERGVGNREPGTGDRE